MDRINGLSDDVLVRILLFLPTKLAVSTSILSKRWEFLWMWLPKLEYYCTSLSESKKLRCFLNKNLPLHRAPVIEILRLNLTHTLRNSEDTNLWIEVALSRNVHELDVHSKAFLDDNILPSSLYACKSLVVLRLGGMIKLDVPPTACLPSLKTLALNKVISVYGDSYKRLLSICPVLQNLLVDFWDTEVTGNISVIVPSLQRLSLFIGVQLYGLEIDTPSLKYLELEVFNNGSSTYISVANMPKLEEAHVDVRFKPIENLIGSITSVKRLTLCCQEGVFSTGFGFNQLEHLKLCDCSECSPKLLPWLLKCSPRLRVLSIFQMEDHGGSEMSYWDEPSTVPECCMSSLQTFNWTGYLGGPRDRDVVVYFLKNARRLQAATISSRERSVTKKFKMIKELSSSSRASTTCQLEFD